MDRNLNEDIILKKEDEIYFESINNAITRNNSSEDNNAISNRINEAIIINNFPRRLIKKGTSSQTGTQFDMSFCCKLFFSEMSLDVIDVKSYIVSSVEGNLQRTEIMSKFEMTQRQHWTVKNMRIKSCENRRSSKHSISEKSLILLVVTIKATIRGQTWSWIKDLYSKPVVVIVHSNQETDAQLTLFIDDYFRSDRNSFIELRGFPINLNTNAQELLECISDYFSKETNRGLTAGNQTYLLDKIRNLFKTAEIPISDIIKKAIPGCKLSFGQWIISVIRLCRNDHINKLWTNDLIEGFIQKDVGHLLERPGYFLLRFAERQAAIGVVLRNDANEIEAWIPFTESECRKINLANHLCDFATLRMLRKADGMSVPKIVTLSPYMDRRNVDDGYTERGSHHAQLSIDDENFEDWTPRTEDLTNIPEDELLKGDSDDMDIDDISDMCSQLLDKGIHS